MTGTPKPPDNQLPAQLQVAQSEETAEQIELIPLEPEKSEQEKAEEFWAGRNHAMRRSARVAA